MPMISILDYIGTISATLAILFMIIHWHNILSHSEKWIILSVCLVTVLVNAISGWSWIGTQSNAPMQENWGDYLQMLQPALWGMFFYVVAQVAYQKRIENNHQRMREIVENMPVILQAYDREGRILEWNRTAEEVSGYQHQEIVGNTFALELLFPDRKMRDKLRDECSQGGGDYHHYINVMRCKEGERKIAWFNISREFPIHGWANWNIGLDVTEQIAMQQHLQHLATHDELTSLPNRTLLKERLRHALGICSNHQVIGALCMLDLDHYKQVNDQYGHPVGDQLLIEVGSRLKNCLRPGDTLARIGGDEFMILLEEIEYVEQAGTIMAKMLQHLNATPFVIQGHKLEVYGSVGITVFPNDDTDLTELLRNADIALYQAKKQGRNGYQFYCR